MEKEKYRVTLKQCIEIVKSNQDRDLIRKKLHFLFSFNYNLDIFCKFFLPKVFNKPFGTFHHEIMEEFSKPKNSDVAVSRGHGKQIADSEWVLTDSGWKRHGDLEIGDKVFSPSGKPLKILATSEKTNSDYVITTRDKQKIRCHGNHEWYVHDRKKHKFVTLETKNMLDCIIDINSSRYTLPLREQLEFETKELLLDPYFLGLWLGDGTKNEPLLTHSKEDCPAHHSTPYKISLCKVDKNTGVLITRFGYNGILGKFRELNIYNNKHIPGIYLRGSISQRLELLAGLIDSDGHVCSKRGRIRFVNVNKKLIDNVEELVIGLGMRPYITSQEPSKAHYIGDNLIKGKSKVYTVNFDPILDIPMRLKRKRIKRFPKRNRLGIVKVEYKPNGEKGKCIQVNSKDGLYLVGKRLIPTHNSSLVGKGIILKKICYNEEKYILYCSRNHELSKMFLEPIKYELKNNRLLKFVYPNIDIKKVKEEDGGRDREDCFDIGKTMRIQAHSFEKNARGFLFGNQRPTLIVFDDIDDDQRVLNPKLRMNDYDKLSKQMIPGLDPECGKYKMIGTIIHLDSILAKRLNKSGGKIYRAYETDDDGNIIEDSILFPELFSKKFFEKYIKDWGSMAASSEYLNNPIDDVTNLIKRKWVKSCFCEDLSFSDDVSEYEEKVQGVDFAFSDRVTADQSAFVGIGKKDDCVDMISCITKKGMSILEQFDFISELNTKYAFEDNGLEENSIRSMSKEIDDYDFDVTLFWTGASDPAIKEKEYTQTDFSGKRYTLGKTSMIKRLTTMFETNYINRQKGKGYTFRIPYKTDADRIVANKILDECVSFALEDGKLVENGVHPDIPIALQLAFETMKRLDGDLVMNFG